MMTRGSWLSSGLTPPWVSLGSKPVWGKVPTLLVKKVLAEVVLNVKEVIFMCDKIGYKT